MKGRFHSEYRSAKGNLVYRYLMTGTEEQLQMYKDAQGEFFTANEEGTPIYFSTKFYGKVITLGFTSKGKIFVDNSVNDRAANIVGQYTGILAEKLAERAADQIFANIMTSGSAQVSAPVTTSVDTEKLDA